MELRFANSVPASFPTAKADIFVAEELTKRTNGAVEVKMFHGGTLGPPTEMIDMIGDGAVDMGNFPNTYVMSRPPLTQFFSIPIVYPIPLYIVKIAACIALFIATIETIRRCLLSMKSAFHKIPKNEGEK